MHTAHRERGFNVIELMVVVTIMAVLLAVGIPAFDNMIKDNRRTSVVNELLSSIMYARAEAAKRNRPVTVCGNTATGGVSCTGGTNWDYGWMVFLDDAGASAAGDGDGAIQNVADMVRRYVNDYSDITIRNVTGGTGHITIKSMSTALDNVIEMTVCDKRGPAKSRVVIVERNGRTRISEKRHNGNAPTCP